MTAYENMAFGLRVRKCSSAEIARRVGEAAELLAVTHCLDRQPGTLSAGEAQRVALGRAIVRRPKLLLLDEPLSNLDPQLRSRMRAEISRLHREVRITMLYVTHDQAEAMTLGERVGVIKGGELQQLDLPLRVYQQPANLFVARFVGSPAINLISGTVRQEASNFSFEATHNGTAGADRFRLRLTPEQAATLKGRVEVVLALRPEHLKLTSCKVPAEDAIGAVAEHMEPLGSETHCYLRWGSQQLVARAPGSIDLSVNQKVCVKFDLDQARFFDPGTELAIKS
jgi:multiple sugar transport system ATP-binding protein